MNQPLLIGRLVGLSGIKGWLKIESYTDPRENIQHYSPWQLRAADEQFVPYEVEAVQSQGKGLVAKLAGIDDRDAAAELLGREIYIDAQQLPALDEGQLYWHDLIGLTVINNRGECLGRVESLMETGANDVLVVQDVEQEVLIPYVLGQVILSVDRDRREIRVAWEKDY